MSDTISDADKVSWLVQCLKSIAKRIRFGINVWQSWEGKLLLGQIQREKEVAMAQQHRRQSKMQARRMALLETLQDRKQTKLTNQMSPCPTHTVHLLHL